jgi:diaminobutyrate-2-oxoglutarate transaminase
MAWGLVFPDGDLAGKVSAAAFEAGLLAETAGPRGQVVKLLPPLTISDAELDEGLSVLDGAIRAVCEPAAERQMDGDPVLSGGGIV